MIDDDAIILHERWYTRLLSPFSLWCLERKRGFCEDLPSTLEKVQFVREFCFSVRPASMYEGWMKEQKRRERLRALMPRWFYPPLPPSPSAPQNGDTIKKSAFILSLLSLLEDLKTQAKQDHGIEIMNAIVSLPTWAGTEIGDLVDEACLLAGIEVFEQPHDRLDMALGYVSAAKEKDAGEGAGKGGNVMVVDHGQYYLDIALAKWSTQSQEYHQHISTSVPGAGSMYLLTTLANLIIGNYNANHSLVGPAADWPGTVGYMALIRAAASARASLIYGPFDDGYGELPYGNRSITINITEPVTGRVRGLNMTASDVAEAEEAYAELIRDNFSSFIDGLIHFDRDQSDTEFRSEDHEWREPPQTQLGEKRERVKIEHVIVLDEMGEMGVLMRAVEEVFGKREEGNEKEGTCIPTHEIPARGAAIRAAEWVVYYEAEQEGDRMYDDDYEDWEDD